MLDHAPNRSPGVILNPMNPKLGCAILRPRTPRLPRAALLSPCRVCAAIEPLSGVQELRLSDVYLGTEVQHERLAIIGSQNRPPLAGLAQLRRLALHVDQHAERPAKKRTNVWQQLAALAPHAGQLTALELVGSEVLQPARIAELAKSLSLLPGLQDLEVRFQSREKPSCLLATPISAGSYASLSNRCSTQHQIAVGARPAMEIKAAVELCVLRDTHVLTGPGIVSLWRHGSPSRNAARQP